MKSERIKELQDEVSHQTAPDKNGNVWSVNRSVNLAELSDLLATAEAMETLKGCIVFADKNCQKVSFIKSSEEYTVILLSNHGYWEVTVSAETLESAISLFHQKLFSK